MSSAIDATKPTAGNALTADMRANFAAAKTEIEALQSGKAELAGSLTQLFKSLNLVAGYTTTATSAGTLTLTASSTYHQDFTGTTTHTAVLPDVTTLSRGHSYFLDNDSTGAITVNSSGGNLVKVFPAGFFGWVTCIAITGTGAASWSVRMPVPDSLPTSGTLYSSSYTPTATNGTNVAASTVYAQSYFRRVGSHVNFELQLNVDPTAAGAFDLELTLPVASNLASARQLNGVAMSLGAANMQMAVVTGNLTNDTMTISGFASDTAAKEWKVVGSYPIL